jgi:hypothetical protein
MVIFLQIFRSLQKLGVSNKEKSRKDCSNHSPFEPDLCFKSTTKASKNYSFEIIFPRGWFSREYGSSHVLLWWKLVNESQTP